MEALVKLMKKVEGCNKEIRQAEAVLDAGRIAYAFGVASDHRNFQIQGSEDSLFFAGLIDAYIEYKKARIANDQDKLNELSSLIK